MTAVEPDHGVDEPADAMVVGVLPVMCRCGVSVDNLRANGCTAKDQQAGNDNGSGIPRPSGLTGKSRPAGGRAGTEVCQGCETVDHRGDMDVFVRLNANDYMP